MRKLVFAALAVWGLAGPRSRRCRSASRVPTMHHKEVAGVHVKPFAIASDCLRDGLKTLDVASVSRTRCAHQGGFMLTGRIARITAAAIVLVAVASAAFRVFTAPERIAKRRAADAQVCAASGGSMAKAGNNDRCVKSTDSR